MLVDVLLLCLVATAAAEVVAVVWLLQEVIKAK